MTILPDVYATIAEADPAVVERLASALEIRAAEPAQGAMRESYLAEVPFPDRSRVLEIGCGTGPVARYIAGLPQVAKVIGIDPSPILLEHARRLSEGLSTVSFQDADGRELPFPDDDFDVVVSHTVLCHVPNPQDVLAEARRVLRPGGCLAIFDGDYSTTSVALGDNDPLQACAKQAVDSLVHDPWIVRRLSKLVESSGFQVISFRSHGFAQTVEPTYLLTLVDRGADQLATVGLIGSDLTEALKGEARQRAEEDRFYGQIAFASLIAERPA
jgi:ubiquinone/menaquinone biosynthesis C-methylase UbiE